MPSKRRGESEEDFRNRVRRENARNVGTRREYKPDRRGGEEDLSIPYHKRRDSYGTPNTERPRLYKNTEEMKESARSFLSGLKDPAISGALDKNYAGTSRMHIRSIEGHDEMTKRSKAEIARRLYSRSNHK